MTSLHGQPLQPEFKPLTSVVHHSFYYSIGDILTNHWDPLGILDSCRAHNKYDRYIKPIYTRALVVRSVSELIQYLNILALNELGIEENLENDKRTSVLILAVRDYCFRNII